MKLSFRIHHADYTLESSFIGDSGAIALTNQKRCLQKAAQSANDGVFHETHTIWKASSSARIVVSTIPFLIFRKRDRNKRKRHTQNHPGCVRSDLLRLWCLQQMAEEESGSRQIRICANQNERCRR